MLPYNIIVNDVQKTKNKILCLARIDNYRNVVKRVSIGQSIRTDPFQLDFDDSIGSSSWILIFYPNGQYVESSNAVVTESGQASMYLQMVDCEHQNDSLAMTIRFFIKSPYCDVLDKFSSSKYANFSYRNLSERWSGPFDLAAMEELYSSRCKNLFLNDSLTIGCELDDTLFHLSASPSMMRLKEKVHTPDTSFSGDRRTSIAGREFEETKFHPSTPVMKSKENVHNTGRSYTDDKRPSTVQFRSDDRKSLPCIPPSMMQRIDNDRSIGRSYTDDKPPSTVQLRLDDTNSRLCTPPSTMQSKENVRNTGRSYTDDIRLTATVGSQSNDNKLRPRTPRTTLQPKENLSFSSKSYTGGRRSLPVGYKADNITFRPCTPQLEMQPKDRGIAVRSTMDGKFADCKDRVKKSSNIGSQLIDKTTQQTVPRVHSTGSPRRTSTFDTDVKVDEFKGGKKRNRMPANEPSAAYRNDSIKENEEEHDSYQENEKQNLCARCKQNDSKKSVTWSEILRTVGMGTDNGHQLSSCCRVKSKVEFFEKIISSKDKI